LKIINAYLDRKFREIELLNGCLAAPFELRRPASAEAAIDLKLRLAAALKAEQALRSWEVTETARPPTQRATSGAFQFSFDYQRADLCARGPPIYPSLSSTRDDFVQETIYTSSGMSALAALLASLSRMKESFELLTAPGCYSETREILQSLGGSVRMLPLEAASRPLRPAAGPARILMLDSSVAAGLFRFLRMPLHDIDLVILDTTCYWRSSSRIRSVVEWATRSGLPLVLVRSHAKLDCLGVEYGRLGSIVVAVPRAENQPRRSDWTAGLGPQIRYSVRLFGAAPILASFPPFTGTRQFEQCSVARVAAIIRNSRRLARTLAARLGNLATVSEFQHGLFLTLRPNAELSVDSAKTMAAELADDLIWTEVPVSHAGSFGFDFVAIEWFADPLIRRNVLRLAASDVPIQWIDRIAEGITRWWWRRASAVRGTSRAASVSAG
jgi:hypothetical protein